MKISNLILTINVVINKKIKIIKINNKNKNNFIKIIINIKK